MKRMTDKLMTNIRGFSIILIAITIAALVLSCQKAEEPKEEKSPQVEKQAIAPSEPAAEVQSEEPVPTEAEEKLATPEIEEASMQKEPEKTAEEYLAESPLTEEEQRFVEEIDGEPSIKLDHQGSKETAIKYLKILLKGDHRNIRYFASATALDDISAEDRAKSLYGEAIAAALSWLSLKDEEDRKFIIEVLETKREYPEALVMAAKIINIDKDKSMIPMLKEIVNNPDPRVRLQAAGTLLSLGDADAALPVLEELTMKEGYTGAMYYLFTGPGKIIDERGYEIIEKALHHKKAEVRIAAANLMLDAKKITNEQAEETALGILEELKDRNMQYYGIRFAPDGTAKIIPAPDSKIANFDSVKQRYFSDVRACEHAISMVAKLKSKKAIQILEYIKKYNNDYEFICWQVAGHKPATNALKAILGDREEE